MSMKILLRSRERDKKKRGTNDGSCRVCEKAEENHSHHIIWACPVVAQNLCVKNLSQSSGKYCLSTKRNLEKLFNLLDFSVLNY